MTDHPMTPTNERRTVSLCPERDSRDAMSEGDFWAHVLRRRPVPEPDDFDDDTPSTYQDTACPECGERGACGYDAEGRALIHAVANEATP